MRRYLLTILAITSLCYISCNKKAVTPNNGAPSGADSYMPVTSGSQWVYAVNTRYSNDTVTVKMNTVNAVLNGKTYYTANATSKQFGTSGIYFYVKDHIYAIRSYNKYANAVMELQVYNDTASINHGWISTPTDDGKVDGTPARVVSTITQRGLTKSFSGKTYNDVVQVEVSIQYDQGFGFQDTNIYVYYLAKGIGVLGYTSNFLYEDNENEAIISSSVK